MSKHLYLGQIGCGNWGIKLLSIFNSMKDVSILRCCDSDRKILGKISKQYPYIIFSENYQDILDDNKINAVIIATPPSNHFDLVENALKHGKHVFVEKPLALNTQDAKKLLFLARKCKKLLMVDHTFLYSPDIVELKSILRKGILGKLLHIEMFWLNLGLFSQETDVIWDLAPHPVSIMFFLLKERPSKVYSYATGHFTKKILDMAHINILLKSHLTTHMFLSWLYPKKVRQITLIGSKAMAIYSEDNGKSKIILYNKNVSFRKNLSSNVSPFKYKNSKSTDLSTYVKIEPLRKACEHFIACVQNGNNPKSDAQNGLEVVNFIEYIHRSLSLGKE